MSSTDILGPSTLTTSSLELEVSPKCLALLCSLLCQTVLPSSLTPEEILCFFWVYKSEYCACGAIYKRLLACAAFLVLGCLVASKTETLFPKYIYF